LPGRRPPPTPANSREIDRESQPPFRSQSPSRLTLSDFSPPGAAHETPALPAVPSAFSERQNRSAPADMAESPDQFPTPTRWPHPNPHDPAPPPPQRRYATAPR